MGDTRWLGSEFGLRVKVGATGVPRAQIVRRLGLGDFRSCEHFPSLKNGLLRLDEGWIGQNDRSMGKAELDYYFAGVKHAPKVMRCWIRVYSYRALLECAW